MRTSLEYYSPKAFVFIFLISILFDKLLCITVKVDGIVLSDLKYLRVTFVYSVVESGSELLPCFLSLYSFRNHTRVLSDDIRNATCNLILSTPRGHTAHPNPHIEHVEIIIRILYGCDRKGDKRRDKRIRER